MTEGRAEATGRLDVAVAALVGELSRSQAARLVKDGRVTVDGRVVDRPASRVREGDVLVVDVPPPVETAVVPQDLPLHLVYEDADLAVIDKEVGRVVHPGAGHPDGTLVNALLFHLEDLSGVGGELRPGIVHRLDRGTSGLLVVAKHDVAHRHLAAQFAAHTAGRTYLALVHGSPTEEAGRIESHLGRHPKDRVRMASVPASQGRRAVTHWRVLGRAGTLTLIQATLETGRTHQVRVHLSEAGWPLVGDGLYRRRNTRVPSSLRGVVDESGDRPLLHAWKLRFEHPRTGELRAFEVPPPPDLQRALQVLGLAPGA